MGLRDKMKRLERAAHGELEYIELEDGARYWYDRLETAKELFLHSIDCLRAAEEWPEPPEVYLKICQAKDPAGALKTFVPPGKPAWFIELPYDRDALVSERRLVPLPHEPVPDLSE